MRVKKFVALIMMIFANIFILAHAALPHSHHDGTVCFSLEKVSPQNSISDCDSDSGSCCTQNHVKHHHHKNAENCDLKQIVLRQSNDTHEDMLPCDHCLSLLYVLYPLNELYLEAPEFGLFLIEKPYLETYIPPFVGSVRSLRAPPFSYFLG